MASDKRLIDANELITTIQGTASQVAMDAPYDPEWFTRLAALQFEILKMIDDAPTVDAVEVVWCKNCASSDTISCSDGMVWCGRMCRYMKEDGFCSFGERKTE